MIALQIPDSTNLVTLAQALRDAGLAISPHYRRDGLHLQPLDRPRTPAERIRQAINRTANRRMDTNRGAKS